MRKLQVNQIQSNQNDNYFNENRQGQKYKK